MQSLIGKVTLNENQVMYLDVLRALAAETVLVSHATRFWQSLQPAAAPAFGVLLFFLISGFLITRSVQNRWDVPGFGFRSYAIERFARIYTAMVPAICLVAIVDAFSADTGHFENADRLTVVNWFGNLAMLQDFPVFLVARRALGDSDWFIRPFGSAQPFWTLSIEWWIYIVFGWVALVRLRGQRLVFWGHLRPRLCDRYPGLPLRGGLCRRPDALLDDRHGGEPVLPRPGQADGPCGRRGRAQFGAS